MLQQQSELENIRLGANWTDRSEKVQIVVRQNSGGCKDRPAGKTNLPEKCPEERELEEKHSRIAGGH